MALSFHPTIAQPFGHFLSADAADMSSFLQDANSEVTEALFGFAYDPLDHASNAAIDDLLNLPLHDDDAAFLKPLIHSNYDEVVELHCAKKQRASSDDAWRGHAAIAGAAQQCINGVGNQHEVPLLPELLLNEFVLPLPLPPPPPQQQQLPEAVAKKATGNVSQSAQSTAARQRRKKISEKTAELSQLIPGGHKLNTAEMLEAAARHVKLLQAQVGMLALMRNVGSTEEEEMPFMAQEEQMHVLLASGVVQERLAAEGRCLVPTKLVDAMAKDSSIKSNALVNRDLGRFVASLQGK